MSNKESAIMKDSIPFQQEGFLYELFYEHTDCSYEILVNDMPVVTHFGLGERSLSVVINQYILKPGKQEITIRLFPQKIDSEKFEDSLSLDSQVKIKITKDLRNANPEWAWTDDAKNTTWTILEYETPKIESGKANAEYKTSIELSKEAVGWQLVGWSESQDLSNDPKIKEEVEAFYNHLKGVLEKTDKQEYLKMLSNSIYEECMSEPWNKECMNQVTKNMGDYAEEKRVFIYPCTHSEVKYYGNGKVVTLVCSDLLTFGYSPLISKTAKNALPKSHTFYLHKPKSSNQLEIIR